MGKVSEEIGKEEIAEVEISEVEISEEEIVEVEISEVEIADEEIAEEEISEVGIPQVEISEVEITGGEVAEDNAGGETSVVDKPDETNNGSMWIPQLGQQFESLEIFEDLVHPWAHRQGFQLRRMQSRLEEQHGQCPRGK